MDTRIRGEELVQLKKEVNAFNRKLKETQTRSTGEELGKDAFLRLLTIQISKQDPLSPMKNTEFVAQMAQFAALEQMQSMNKAMGKVQKDISILPMFSMIGKEVKHYDEASESYLSGQVEGIFLGKDDAAMLVVEGKHVLIENIVSIQDSQRGMLGKSAYQGQVKTSPHAFAPAENVVTQTQTPEPALSQSAE